MSAQGPLPSLTPFDNFPTPTSIIQHETEESLLEHHPNHPIYHSKPLVDQDKDGKPTHGLLNKPAHMQFLVRHLMHGFGARYVSQDASQPWLMFWTLQSFSALSVVLDPGNKQRVIDKIMAWQHPKGGFGGGPGQAPHLLTTYASICSLAIVGHPGPGGGWDAIDRPALYAFFLSLKQPDGSFLVAHHAEVDVRGVYCLLVVATLLDILTPELVEGTPFFVASCQTYEGGFASASIPSYDPAHPEKVMKGAPRPPLGEAHGGYTFCALASWVLLQPYLKASIPNPAERPSVDLRTLTRWLIQMQGVEAELGGFRGRTNKLVDGCYAWWIGGSFGLLESLGGGGLVHIKPDVPAEQDQEQNGEWVDIDDGLFNSRALQEYILYACQGPSGGLRDKPSKPSDAYHTLYCLSGLSSAQHHISPSLSKKEEVLAGWAANERVVDLGGVSGGGNTGNQELSTAIRRNSLAELLSWSEDPASSKLPGRESFGHIVGGKENRLNATHPITNLTVTHTVGIAKWAYGIVG